MLLHALPRLYRGYWVVWKNMYRTSAERMSMWNVNKCLAVLQLNMVEVLEILSRAVR